MHCVGIRYWFELSLIQSTTNFIVFVAVGLDRLLDKIRGLLARVKEWEVTIKSAMSQK